MADAHWELPDMTNRCSPAEVLTASELGAKGSKPSNFVQHGEKFKAEWRSSGESLSLSRFLGRLRYPPR